MKKYIAYVKISMTGRIELSVPASDCSQAAIEKQARIAAKKKYRDADDVECIEYEEVEERPRTCESCMKFQETCSRVIIDNPCFQYAEEVA